MNKKNACNPYLPLYEYIPDGEPRVYNNRLYIYGSHDRAGGDFFCLEDYAVWSAPITNLADWKYEGISYRKDQDPSNSDGNLVLFAPDVVKGPDGRYYLYYCLQMVQEFGVAVSDSPEGPFTFLDHIHYSDGRILSQYMPYDPSIFVDDDGKVYLYYGFSSEMLSKRFHTEVSPGAMCVELASDMVTALTEPNMLIPWEGLAKGTEFEGHAYFEAPSMRKIGEFYYLVYSSQWCRELCYAISKYPDRDFTYGGVIIDNCDLGLKGNNVPVCMPGNNHGGLVTIGEEVYLFYHRHTNGNSFSRQGCAERVQILEDGSIPQVELTSCGLNKGPLPAKGTWQSPICCHLSGKNPEQMLDFRNVELETIAYITENCTDSDEVIEYIKNIKDDTIIGYKYFEANDLIKGITMSIRGTATGTIQICLDEASNTPVATHEISINCSDWIEVLIPLQFSGVHALYFVFHLEGEIDFKEFSFVPEKPHIIIFNPDEMRAECLAHLGDDAAITPNLDEFARQDAVSFRNAYCQNPVCVPSRCSFFTGLYPHVNGHRTMSHLLRPGESSMFSEMKDEGYYVWMNDRNDLVAGQIPGWAESHATEIYYNGQKKHGPGPVNHEVRGSLGNKNFYSHYDGELGVNEEGINYNSDDEVVDAAISRIKNRPLSKPLCMFLGLMFPHTPYQVEEPYFSAIDRRKLRKRIKTEDCSKKSKIIEKIRSYTNMEEYTEDDWNELRAVYQGMCMKIDHQFGKLVDALKEEGIYEDCAIFFLSDHGDFAGDYGLVEKAQNSFEDCLTKVPLLVKPPKGYVLDPGVSDSLVELVDFYATAMDMAGIVPTHTQFGQSLVPQLADRSKSAREYVFCEGGRQPGELHCDEYHSCGPNGAPKQVVYWPKMMAQTDDEAHAKGIMIREERYKYVSRTLGQDELYDLQEDPYEMTNLIGDSSYTEVVTRMQTAMLKWLQRTDDIVPYDLDERFTPEMLWAKVRGLVPKDKEEEVRSLIDRGVSFTVLMAKCRELNK